MQDRCPLCRKVYSYRIREYCSDCGSLKVRIDQQRRLSQRKRLECDLTLSEWIRTLEDFNYRCAYCKADDFLFIEHFIPTSLRGGTTRGNCVPACIKCNNNKRSKHPDEVTLIPRDAIERVCIYLHQFLKLVP